MLGAQTQRFILNSDAPVLHLKGMRIEDTGIVLKTGTVVEGRFMERKVRDENKENFVLPVIEVKQGKDKSFVPAASANLFFDKYSNSNGLEARDRLLRSKVNKGTFLLKYGLPIAAMILGFVVAKRRGLGTTGMIITVIGSAAAGSIPYQLSKTKSK
jgi:hypothetical protein